MSISLRNATKWIIIKLSFLSVYFRAPNAIIPMIQRTHLQDIISFNDTFLLRNCLMWLFCKEGPDEMRKHREGTFYSLVIWLTSNELMVSKSSRGLTRQLAYCAALHRIEKRFVFNPTSWKYEWVRSRMSAIMR